MPILRRLLIAAALIAAPVAGRAQETRTLGTVTLERCTDAAPDGWCGHIERPLDPAEPALGETRIGFEWYPAAEGRALGTIVAIQGGPGFATTGARLLFRAALAGATEKRNLLLFDMRGTGLSEPIVCAGAQAAPRLFDPAAAASCARELGPRAGLFGTVAAADDLAALLDRLGLARVDLYGVSYGTVFEQVFALRHPERVRTLVLDSALPIDADLFARGAAGWRTFGQALDAVCKRDPTCRPGRLRADLDALYAAVADGRAGTVGAGALSDTFMNAGYDGTAYRALAAAVAAWRRGDAAPLDRLIAATEASLGLADIPPSFGSAGTFLAVSCTDMPMPFDVAADPATRRREAEAMLQDLLATEENLPPVTEAELADARAMATFCADWPAPPPTVVPVTALRAEGPYPAVPTLVLSGELDTVTPPALGAVVAGRFPRGIRLVVRNALHGTALPSAWMTPAEGPLGHGCVPDIIGRFIASLSPGDLACLADRPALRVAALPPRTLAEATPAAALSGTPSESDLRIAAAAAGAVGDAVARFGRIEDTGLRGGTVRLYSAAEGYVLALSDVRWVEDVTVGGSIRLLSRPGIVTGTVAVTAPGGVTGTLQVSWVERDAAPTAMVTGTLEGGPAGQRRIYASLPAP